MNEQDYQKCVRQELENQLPRDETFLLDQYRILTDKNQESVLNLIKHLTKK